MGSMESLLKMIPGFGKIKQLKNFDADSSELKRIEAIICSMTPKERRNISIFNASRRRRVAKGSGTKVSDVNALIKNFTQTRKMMKKVSGGGLKALGRGLFPM
jgi:signal recognition particle subunit SRP54